MTQMALQMLAVAVGYEIFELTNSPLWLGLSGLVQFIPRIVLFIPAGVVADKYDRRKVAAITQTALLLTALFLALIAYTHIVTGTMLLVVVFIYGLIYAMQGPSLVSLLPNLVSKKDFPKSTARVSSVQQVAIIVGPAVAGFLYIFGPTVVYICVTMFNFSAILLVLSLRRRHIRRVKVSQVPESPLAGFRYIIRRPGLFGAISLDMFAVLFSGVTALLPVFAEQILHTGSVGFGLMRSAPAVGALAMSAVLSIKPIVHKTGKIMLGCVAAYGALTIVFALSSSLYLSVAVLAIMGVVDMVSMVIRSTYVQVSTSDEVRGRVNAVNFIFIGASNQLGEFESGAVAALIGVIPAVIFGGVATLGIVAAWYYLFPPLRNLDKIE
jgi:MFS family permease